MINLTNIKDNYSSEFINAILTIKSFLLVFFILVSIIYILKNKINIQTYTMINSKKYFNKLILSCLLDAFCGLLTIIFIYSTRNNSTNILNIMMNNKHELITIVITLFLFKFIRESSGLNKWTGENQEIYQEIITQENTIKHINICNEYNPFENAFATSSFIFIMLFIGRLLIIMLLSSYYGYQNNNLTAISSQQLITEIFIIGIINALPSIVNSYIFNNKKYMHNVILMSGSTIAIHLMSQLAGIYKTS